MKPETLKAYRKQCDLTQREMAEELGVSYSIFSKWESGAAPIPSWVPKFVRKMTSNDFSLKPEELSKVRKHLKETNKSMEDFIAGLIRAALLMAIISLIPHVAWVWLSNSGAGSAAANEPGFAPWPQNVASIIEAGAPDRGNI